jgi:hypothetical protein
VTRGVQGAEACVGCGLTKRKQTTELFCRFGDSPGPVQGLSFFQRLALPHELLARRVNLLGKLFDRLKSQIVLHAVRQTY